MPTYEYKGHQFSSDRELSAEEWKQTLAHIDSLEPKKEQPKMGGFGAKKYFDETNPENPMAGLEEQTKKGLTNLAAYGDIALGLPGMALGLAATPVVTGYNMLQGQAFPEAYKGAVETTAPLGQPLQSALKGTGQYSEQAAQENLANRAMGKLGEGVSYLGEQAAEATGIPAMGPLTEFGLNTAMLGYGIPGAKKVGKIVKEKVIEPVKEKLTTITEADLVAERARRESVAAENRLYEPPKNVLDQRTREAQAAAEVEQRNVDALKELQAIKAEQAFREQQQRLTAEPGETAQLPFTEEIKLPQGDLFEGGMLPPKEVVKGISKGTGERTGLREALPLEETLSGKIRQEMPLVEEKALPQATPLESAVDKVSSGQKFAMSAEERIAFEKTKAALEVVEPEFKTLSDKQILERMMDREWVQNAINKSRQMDAMYEDIAKRTRDAETRNEMLKNREMLADHLDLLEEQLRKMPTEKVGQGPKTREARMNEVAAGRQGIIQMRTFNPVEAAIESYKLAEPMMKKALEIMDKYGEEAAKVFINTYNQQEVNNKYNVNKSATVSNLTVEQTKAMSNMPWWSKDINEAFIPVENFQTAVDSLKGTSTDIKSSFTLENLTSGGVMQSAHANHPVARVGIDIVNSLKKGADRFTEEDLNNRKDGLLVLRQQITKTLGDKAFNDTILQMVQASLDPEFKPTYSELGQKWVDSYRKKADATLERNNAARKLAGLPEVKRLENYFSLMREGPFGFIVEAATGKFDKETGQPLYKQVAFVRERSMKEAKAAYDHYISKVAEQGLDWRVGTPERNEALGKSPFTKTARGSQLHMEDIKKILGETDPDVIKAGEIYDNLLLNEARQTYGAINREKARSGMEGAMGAKPWKTSAENVKEAIQAIERYFNQVNNQTASIEAAHYVRQIMRDEAISAPNAKRLVQNYYDHAFNRTEKIIEATSDFWRHVEETTGKEVGFYLNGIRVGKNALMGATLGFYNARFLATQLIQPWQTTPPLLAYLKSSGAEGNATLAMAMGLKDSLSFLAQQYTPHARPKFQDKLTAAIWDYAEKQHITAAHLLEAPKEYSSKSLNAVTNFVGKMATGEMQKFEAMTRMHSFSTLTRFLVDSGVPLKEALGMAERGVEFSMTSYEQHNKPQIFAKAGFAGELASNLQTYKHNIVGQQLFYAKEAAKGKPRAAFVQQLNNVLLFGGALGLIGMAESDNLLNMINEQFGTDIRTPSEYLLTKLPKFVAVGGISAVTDFDFQGSLGSQGLLPKSPTEAVFPLAGKVQKIAQTTGRAISNPTEENILAAAREPISSLAGVAEAGLSQKAGPNLYAYRNPNTRETEALRTKGEVITRALTGLKPIEESIEAKKNIFAKKSDIGRADRRSALLQDIKENVAEINRAQETNNQFRVNAAKEKNSKLVEEYYKNGGTPQGLSNEISGHIQARGLTTPMQRRLGESLKGQPTVEKALRMQKLLELMK